jgi:hypothetical protein
VLRGFPVGHLCDPTPLPDKCLRHPAAFLNQVFFERRKYAPRTAQKEQFAVLAASVCSAQDERQTTNPDAGKDEGDIKQLISMYAKAAEDADLRLASRIWCDSAEDSLINPVARWHGVEQIMGFY